MNSHLPGKPLKVLFLSAWYPTRYDSMFGLFVQKHARAVALQNHVVVIHVCRQQGKQEKTFAETRQEGKLHEYILYYRHREKGLLKRPANFLRWVAAYYKALRWMKQNHGLPDICHVNILTRTALWAYYLKWRYKIPYVISEHWSRYFDTHSLSMGVLHKRLTKYLIGQSGGLTVVSEKLGDAMVKQGLCKSFDLLPNVVDTRLFRIRPHAENAERKTLVHISCFEEISKNMSGILHGVKLLSQKRNDFILQMVGEGADLPASIALAEELGIKDKHVVFTGLLEGEKLAKLLSRARALVLFSHYETFGIVVYESLACGIPVAVSNVADFSRHISQQLGVITPDTGPATIAKTMDYMLDNYQNYKPEELRSFITQNYSPETISLKTNHLYQSVLGKTSKRHP